MSVVSLIAPYDFPFENDQTIIGMLNSYDQHAAKSLKTMAELDKKPSPKTSTVWILALIPVAISLAATLAYFVNFGPSIADKQDIWGQFGDFLGGVINPVVGLVTVVLLVLTLKAQRDELREQRQELRLQRQESARSTAALDAQYRAIQAQSLEQSLFAWLGNYRELLDSVVYTRDSISARGLHTFTRTGRDALTEWYENNLADKKVSKNGSYVNGIYKESLDNPKYDSYDRLFECFNAGDKEAYETLILRIERTIDEYRKIYSDNRTQFDALFRTLYKLFEWIDSADVEPNRKWHYAALVRAQLSWIELIFIVFNGLMSEGQKFASLINRYAIFDNIAQDSDQIICAFYEMSLKRLEMFKGIKLDKIIWPYTDSAFSSEIAKEKLFKANQTRS